MKRNKTKQRPNNFYRYIIYACSVSEIPPGVLVTLQFLPPRETDGFIRGRKSPNTAVNRKGRHNIITFASKTVRENVTRRPPACGRRFCNFFFFFDRPTNCDAIVLPGEEDDDGINYYYYYYMENAPVFVSRFDGKSKSFFRRPNRSAAAFRRYSKPTKSSGTSCPR